MVRRDSGIVSGDTQPVTVPYPVPKRHKINIPLIGYLIGGAAAALTGTILFYNIIRNEYRPTPREPTKQTQISDQNSLTVPILSLETPTQTPREPIVVECRACTQEELEYYTMRTREAYKKVTDVYGMEVGERLSVIIGPRKQAYSVGFEKDLVGGIERAVTIDDSGLGYPVSHFDDGRISHEVSHRFLKKLFPTYHSWFDEGLAMYAEGHNFGERRGYKELKEDVSNWRKAIGAVPGHAVGAMFFSGLIEDYSLTPEKNRTALSLLRRKYLETGRELRKAIIKEAYETALGVSLDPLFDLLRPGVITLYPDLPGTHIEKIRNEF